MRVFFEDASYLEQRFRCSIDLICAQLDLESTPASIGELEDGVYLSIISIAIVIQTAAICLGIDC